MTDVAIQKASLWRETWKAIKGSAPALWPWVLACGVLLSPFYFIHGQPSDLSIQLQDNPQLLQQHPEIMGQLMHEALRNSCWFLPILLFNAVGYYVFTVKYLQFAMKKNRPELSVNGFFYWFAQLFLKWLRGLWVLLPFIGWFFFYPRAIIRYQLVSPLAVLQRGDELKTSWNLTENNFWRIVGNAFLLTLLLFVIMLPLWIIMGITAGIAGFQHVRSSSGLLVVFVLVQVLVSSASMACFSIFSCTCYRILSQEARPKPPLPAAEAMPSS